MDRKRAKSRDVTDRLSRKCREWIAILGNILKSFMADNGLFAIYFSGETVYFKSEKGVSHSYTVDSFVQLGFSDGDAEYVKQLWTPVGGPNGSLIPAIPSTDIDHVDFESQPLTGSLSFPLIKCAHDDSDKVLAFSRSYASGIRSAIVEVSDGNWVRLKGCGNHSEGFISIHKPNYSTIRGCCFKHTAYRELYMTKHIENLLRTHLPKCLCGNSPLGWFAYEKHPVPNVPAFCSMFECLGDRRLGTHLLLGLERLFPVLFTELTSESVKKQCKFFPAERLDPESGFPLPSWIAVLSGVPPLHNGGLDLKVASKIDIPVHIPEEMGCLFNSYIEILRSVDVFSLLVALYSRLGFECGSIIQVLHSNDVNWGTYTDTFGAHCNAHSNNLVVCHPDLSDGEFLLAPVDFDMSFTKGSFIQVDHPEARYTFDELITLERNSMLMTLAGDEEISSGVDGSSELSPEHRALKWILRDHLIFSFEKLEDPGPVIPGMRALICLALLMTRSDEA